MRFGSLTRIGVVCLLVAITGGGRVVAQTSRPATHWVGSWAASQQVPETQNLLDAELMRDATLRQIVHLTVGGESVAGAGVECVWDSAAASDGGACGAARVGGECGDRCGAAIRR